MRDILKIIGGPNGISVAAWLILAPISIFLTQEVVPEGLLESPIPAAGYIVGLIGHLVTGLVLFAGKLVFLRGVAAKSRPLTTLTIMVAAGFARGYSVAFSLELLQLVESADYFERMRSGAVLIVVWFGVAGLVIDSRVNYRKSFEGLTAAIDKQLLTRERGENLIVQARSSIIEQIKQTLSSALRSGSSSNEIHLAVDDLIRPLSHRLAADSMDLMSEGVRPKRKIKVRPVIRTAVSKTAFNPVPTAAMAVLGTITSLLWTEGPIAIVGAGIDFVVIWAVMEISRRLKSRGIFTPLAWFLAGFASAAASDLVTNPNPWSNLQALLYLSANVMVPAALLAFLAAYRLEGDRNLERLRQNLSLLDLETQALQQRLFIERKRLARFVHSELQSRLRAFALRLDFEGRTPSEKEMEKLRSECEAALVFDDESQSFEAFFASQRELWSGVVELELKTEPADFEALAFDSYTSSAAVELVREGITNAVKHGKAKHVEVSLSVIQMSQKLGLLELRVSNDGEPIKQGSPGLGSQIISEMAPNYELQTRDGKTELSARLPIRIQTASLAQASA